MLLLWGIGANDLKGLLHCQDRLLGKRGREGVGELVSDYVYIIIIIPLSIDIIGEAFSSGNKALTVFHIIPYLVYNYFLYILNGISRNRGTQKRA